MKVYTIFEEYYDGFDGSEVTRVFKVVSSKEAAIKFCSKMNGGRGPYSSFYDWEEYEVEE